MYLTLPPSISFLSRALLMSLLLLLVCGERGYGQRVYADAQQSSAKISALITLSEVTNQNNSIDSDTSNYSTLRVVLDLAGIMSAHQNLQFTNNKPATNSPVIIKFGTPNTLATLLGGLFVQRTNGGQTTFVQPAYGAGELLNLLNLFGSEKIRGFIIPPNGLNYDGVRLGISTVLGVGRTANFYYAFFITPPIINQNSTKLCAGETIKLTISNAQTGYIYRVYNQSINGTLVPGINVSGNTITIEANVPAGNYWVEAREGDLYPSGRTQITINPKISTPTVVLNPNSQY